MNPSNTMDTFGQYGPVDCVMRSYFTAALVVFGLTGCHQDRRAPWDTPERDATGETGAGDDRLPACWHEANSGNPKRCYNSAHTDADSDGLSDREEESRCSDPDDEDTDGDGLSDCEEVERGLDPCESDTDGDGFSDREELELCLDPTDAQRPSESQEWIFSACETAAPDQVDTKLSNNGLWQYATGRWTEQFSTVEYLGEKSWGAMGTFEIPSIGGHGAVVSFPIEGTDSEDSTEQMLDTLAQSTVEGFGDVNRRVQGELLRSVPSYLDSRWSLYGVETTRSQFAGEVRDKAALAVAGFQADDFADLPDSGNRSAEGFVVGAGLSVERRKYCRERESGERMAFAVVVVAPEELSEMERSILRIASSPRRVHWGTSTALKMCRRYPLTTVPRTSGQDRESGDDFLLEIDRDWIPGTAQVKAGGNEISFADPGGYAYEPVQQNIVLDNDAIPSELPSGNHRFASVWRRQWVVRCRGSCAPYVDQCLADD
jgi:hypothetical protein